MENRFEPTKELDHIAKQFIGVAIEVHRNLGPGYLESVYEKSLCIEMEQRNINFQCQVEVPIYYKGKNVGIGKLDLIIENKLIVELKTVDSLLPIHRAQLISYLKATNKQLGLLVNFKSTMLKQGIKRIIYSK